MSRIGKQPIEISTGVEAKVDGQHITVKGPKGTLSFDFHKMVSVVLEDKQIKVSVGNPDNKLERSLWGTTQKLIQNMVNGVVTGFSKKLEVNGVGYKVALSGKLLTLNVGYSHEVKFKVPEGIDMSLEKNVITVSGIDKQLVGETAARIRKVKKPEPYKGKGIKYSDEVIIRKQGKQAKAA